MRLFWAIELPSALRDRLGAVQEDIRRACPRERVGWVGTCQMHVTFKFLGDVADPDPVVEAARAVVPPAGRLSLAVQGLGTFGGRQPRVVWAGVEGPDLDAFSALVGRVERALVPLGFEAEPRAFRPHVTLGRVRGGRGRGKSELARFTRGYELPALPFTAGELVLFQSSLGQQPGPPDYTARARLPLGEPDTRLRDERRPH